MRGFELTLINARELSTRTGSLRAGFLAWLAPLAILYSAFAAADLDAQRLPSYSAARAAMPAVWAERYPLTAKEFRANPGARGVLRAYFRGRYVYYYRFEAVLARPVRAPGDSTELIDSGERTVEFWARYRAWLAKPWDLSFVREDRLPGSAKRWIKVGE